jgi:hypothetical protein
MKHNRLNGAGEREAKNERPEHLSEHIEGRAKSIVKPDSRP